MEIQTQRAKNKVSTFVPSFRSIRSGTIWERAADFPVAIVRNSGAGRGGELHQSRAHQPRTYRQDGDRGLASAGGTGHGLGRIPANGGLERDITEQRTRRWNDRTTIRQPVTRAPCPKQPVGRKRGEYGVNLVSLCVHMKVPACKCAQALDADASTRSLGEGILNRAAGRELWEKILAKDGSEDLWELYGGSMGGGPHVAVLLRRAGLAPALSSGTWNILGNAAG